MLSLKVNLREANYNIVIGPNILKELGATLRSLEIGTDAVIVTHPKLLRMHGRPLLAGLKQNGFSTKIITVSEGERSKSVRQAISLIEAIAKEDVQKKIFLVAFGGGVVGDLTGFVAAVYRRGIPYIQVPTSFLAQIDSAIGGKVAVDLPVGKNLIGAFYQPRLVFSDVALLASLSKRQIRNGLAEAIKYGIICDTMLFHFIEQNAKRLLAVDLRILQEVVSQCARIKARIIVSDERETRGVRTILNFGHTVGHAIEAANRYQYEHGEAVALGMRVATDISRRLRILTSLESTRIQKVLTSLGLPEKIQKVKFATLLEHMQHDKKFHGDKNRFVLVYGIGRVKVAKDVPWRVVHAAVDAFR